MSLNIGLAGKHTGVHELYGGDGAMLVYRVSNRCQVRYAVVTVELEVFGDINAVYRVYVCLAHMDDGTAAACLALIKQNTPSVAQSRYFRPSGRSNR